MMLCLKKDWRILLGKLLKYVLKKNSPKKKNIGLVFISQMNMDIMEIRVDKWKIGKLSVNMTMM